MHFFQCRLIPGAERRRQIEWCSMLASPIECSLNGGPPAPPQSWERQGPWIYGSWRDLVCAPLYISQDGPGYAVVTNILKNLCGLKHWSFIFHSQHISYEGQRWPALWYYSGPKMLGSISQHIYLSFPSPHGREKGELPCLTLAIMFLEMTVIISAYFFVGQTKSWGHA